MFCIFDALGVLSRACTAQEKGGVLTYLLTIRQ